MCVCIASTRDAIRTEWSVQPVVSCPRHCVRACVYVHTHTPSTHEGGRDSGQARGRKRERQEEEKKHKHNITRLAPTIATVDAASIAQSPAANCVFVFAGGASADWSWRESECMLSDAGAAGPV